MTKAVLAVDVQAKGIDLRPRLRGVARKFAPHITLVPRFAFRGAIDRHRDQWQMLARELIWAFPDNIELRGIRHLGRGLSWYECSHGCRGFQALRHAHDRSLQFLSDTIGAAPPPDHVGRRYRPHLTLIWHSFAENSPLLPPRITVSAKSIVLYHYAETPLSDTVRRTEILSRP